MRSGRGRCEIETLPAVRSSNIFYVFISTMIFLLVIHLRSTLIPKHVTAERAYESLLSLLLTGAVFADHLTDMSWVMVFSLGPPFFYSGVVARLLCTQSTCM